MGVGRFVLTHGVDSLNNLSKGSQALLDNIGVYALSGKQTLTDLGQPIRVLKALVGIPADLQEIPVISGDGKIGLAEVIYLLQKATGLRKD